MRYDLGVCLQNLFPLVPKTISTVFPRPLLLSWNLSSLTNDFAMWVSQNSLTTRVFIAFFRFIGWSHILAAFPVVLWGWISAASWSILDTATTCDATVRPLCPLCIVAVDCCKRWHHLVAKPSARFISLFVIKSYVRLLTYKHAWTVPHEFITDNITWNWNTLVVSALIQMQQCMLSNFDNSSYNSFKWFTVQIIDL